MRRESTRQTLMLLKVLVKAKAEHGSSLAQTCGDFIALHLSSVGSSSRVLANTADAPSGSAELTPCSCMSAPHSFLLPTFPVFPINHHTTASKHAGQKRIDYTIKSYN